MKKLYIAGLLCLGIAVQAHAQSLVPVNGTLYMQSDPNTLIDSHVDIHNTAATSLDVAVDRVANNLAGSHFSYFCWGPTCYGPGTNSAPAEAIPSGSTNTTFRGYLNPSGSTGVSTVTYCFYDVNNPQDSICLEFVYDVTPQGVNEIDPNVVDLSSPRPNPAVNFTQISYSAGAGASDVRIVLSNMLGAKVRELQMSRNQDVILLATSALKPGLYFYSLVVDHQVLVTKKLVIAGRE
jgi:hypothetical protein